MSFISIQINQIQIYRLSSFPERRINELISELNVHYGKINGYIEAKIDQEKINIEIIDSLSKLEEINRLAPHRIQSNSMAGDFRLGVDVLESIVALLHTQSGHEGTRKKLLSIGWSLLQKLYQFSFYSLIDEALLFNWLKLQNLVRPHQICRYAYRDAEQDGKRIQFSPSKEDIDSFYSTNRSKIYNYMIYEMGQDKSPIDPFSQSEAADFYHYHQTLSNVSVHPESAA